MSYWPWMMIFSFPRCRPSTSRCSRRPCACCDLMPLTTRAGREPERRLALGVVDAAGDDRLVGIALEEVDDHFLADARRGDTRPSPCRPTAATRGSSTSCSRPSCRSDPSGTAPSRGRTCRCRSPRRPGPTTTAVCGPWTNGFGVMRARPELLLRWTSRRSCTGSSTAAVRQRLVVAELQVVAGRDDQVLAVLIGARKLVQREQATRPRAPRALVDAVRSLELACRARRCGPRRTARRRAFCSVLAGIVEDLEVARRVARAAAPSASAGRRSAARSRSRRARRRPAGSRAPKSQLLMCSMLRPRQPLGRDERRSSRSRATACAAARVGQHQRVVAVACAGSSSRCPPAPSAG